MADHEINIVVKGRNQTGNLFGSVTSGITALNQALEIARKVAEALKKAYDAAREGAALEYSATRFDNLAKSIGTVSDALLTDLRDATHGMVSDSELMASAADFMGLGLAKTHDEVVRLSTVAGALGMNMNQLVLTLTNQTTMRFDALGVSVAGFDEKVKALEESGMSASEAFTEAFLQQAEEQIERVGDASDSTIGDFKRLEAQVKNLGDSFKQDTVLPIMQDVIPAFQELVDAISTIELDDIGIGDWLVEQVGQFESVILQLNVMRLAFQAFNSGDISLKSFIGYMDDAFLGLEQSIPELKRDIVELNTALDKGNAVLGETTKATAATAQAQDDLVMSIFDSTENWGHFKAKMGEAGIGLGMMTEAIYYEEKALQGATVETDNLTEATDELSVSAQQAIDDYNLMVVELEKITGLDQNFSGIISYARKYDDILKEIQGNETRITELMGTTTTEGIAERDALIAKNAELSQQMTDMANQVVLDMFAATIAIGGVTDAELEAYFTLAEEMGIISKEAADEAIAQYKRAEDYVREHQFPDQTFQIIGQLVMPDIPMGGSGSGGGWVPFHNEAAGGVVSAAAGAMGGGAYYVGEIGPELFFPAQNGRVVSNSEAKASLRSGRGGGETIVVNISTPMNFADKAWVERELAPYITKAIRSERIRG